MLRGRRRQLGDMRVPSKGDRKDKAKNGKRQKR
jgi:hypothetical protein